jgi:Ca2+-binding RTX toxin-like protein
MSGIEIVNVTSNGATSTLGLANAAAVTSVSNNSSSNNLVVTGIAAGASLEVKNVASDTTTFTYATTTGVESAALTVDEVTGGAAAEITIAGVETISVTAVNAASVYELRTAAATTLNFAGAVEQTVTLDATTLSVSKFDASAATAAVTLTTIDQTNVAGATDVTVLGGAGNDTLTLVESNDVSVNGGAGDDKIVMAGIDTADTVDGGAGTDILETTSAQANVLDAAAPTTYIITNVETLQISDTFNGTLTAANIATSITKVVLSNTAGGNLVTGGNDTIAGGAGNFALDLGASGPGNTDVLGGALVVRDTGTATTDAVIINNTAVDSTTGINLDVFSGTDLTSTGYESVSINTGSLADGPEQDIGTLTITPDATTAAVSLILSGTNAIEIATSLTTTSTGLMTVDASGLTAQDAGTATLTIASTTSGTAGTQSITGSAGDDSIVTGNFAATISGGAGNDTITGGTTADNLSGDAGDDVITGTSGNDTVLGGAGNDTITVGAGSVNVDGGAGNDTVSMGATATSGDTVTGGDGTDTLVLTSAVTTGTIGTRFSGFEILSTAATAQVLSNFVNNSFTEIVQAAAGNGTLAITNAGSTFSKITSLEADALVTSFARLADGAADSLTIVAGDAIIATSALTASGEETIVIDARDFGVDLDLVTSTSLKSLTITGDNVTDIDAQAATELATIDASGFSGAVALTVDASDSTSAVTFTGGVNTGTTTLTTGTGADLVTAGAATAVLNVTTGLGNDTVIGNAGADIIVTGSGADSITGGNGSDSITAGSGSDSINLTETIAAVDVIVLTSTGLDSVTKFAYGASGDQIEFDISDLEAAFNIDFTNLDDGASTADTEGLIQEVTADVAATANATFFILRGATFESTSDVENALETGDFEISHAGGAAGDGFLVAYSDGVDVFVALVRDNVATSATDFTAGELTVTNLVKLIGNVSLSASEFNIANFDFIA